MSKPKVHGVGGSPFVRKVLVALAEKGIEYELVMVMPMAVSAEFRRISPLGKIPVYQEGDFTLPDSSCILAYLERVHPEPALYPRDAKQFGRALWLEEYSDSKLTEVAGSFFFNRVVKKMMKQASDEALLAKLKSQELPPIFDYLETELGGRDVLVGTHFSVADIAVCSILVNFRHAGETIDAGRWPRLAAYHERHLARPSFKGLLESERAFLATLG